MASALRQRAVTEAAAAGEGRVEPVMSPEGGQLPVVTDEVTLDAAELDEGRGAASKRQGRAWVQAALRWPMAQLARSPVSLKTLALVGFGVGLSLFGVGVALYLWPATPKPATLETAAPVSAPASAPASAPVVSAAASVLEAEPSAHAESPTPRIVLDKPSIVPPIVLPIVKPVVVASTHEAPSVPSAPSAPAASQPEPPVAAMEATPDLTYGADGGVDGVPDALDRWLVRTLKSPAAQESARQYYRTALPLATKSSLGVMLSKSEKTSVLRSAECYLVTATEEGLRTPPNLNDRVLLQGASAAERMKGLFKQLQGTDYPVSGNRQQACL